MRVLTGRVVAGKIDVEGEVADGTPVAVLAPDGQEPRLTPEDEAQLSEALDEIHRGHYEDGFALLREIKAQATK
jgi:hypothetical protein